MNIIKFNTPIQKKEYVDNVKKLLDSKESLHGPGRNIEKIKKQLKDQFGYQHVHLTSSCTASMEMCALILNLKKNDEVIMPSYNYNTTGSSFVRTGCQLRYCDVDKNNLMPTFGQIKSCVNKKTKAIVIVHMQGLPIDYLDKLQKFCKEKKIFLIEDAAPALGSYVKNKPVGSYGDFGCFSFHETKNFQSGGMGGLLVVNNKKLRRKSDLVFDKGTDRTSIMSDPNYHKKYYTWVEMGSCFRMPELNASYLQPQIKEIKNINKYRSVLYKRYVKNFSSWLGDEFTICNKLVHKYKYNYHAFTIILKKNEREKFLKFLKKNKILAFIGFMPLHTSRIGRRFLSKKDKLSNTDEIVKKIVRLPMHNRLNIKKIDFVSKIIKKYFRN